MTCLNVDLSPAELADVHGERDYYRYLRSPAYVEGVLRPVADAIVHFGSSCLDAACGEGLLADLLPSHLCYAGFDGSATAVERSRARRPDLTWLIGRIEAPPALAGPFRVLALGGVMEVLVKPEARVDLVRMYSDRFGCRHLALWDLERLDTTPLTLAFGRPKHERRLFADIVGEAEVKKHRKLLVYEVAP